MNLTSEKILDNNKEELVVRKKKESKIIMIRSDILGNGRWSGSGDGGLGGVGVEELMCTTVLAQMGDRTPIRQ